MFVVGMYMHEFEILHNSINFKITIIAFISLALIVFLWRIFFFVKNLSGKKFTKYVLVEGERSCTLG